VRLADSHSHILDTRLENRAEEIVANMETDGLDFIVEVSAGVKQELSSHKAVAFANKHPRVYCTIGVHPHNAHEYDEEFEKWAGGVRSPKLVAYGEIGLDYHYPDASPKQTQIEIFARQIKLADKLKLPLIIHTRDAFDDTLQTLVANKKHIRNGILFHCFSGDATQVAQIRKHFDAYFAFGGAITYTCETSDEAIRTVPLNRMLLETDAPYLNPKTCGGKKIINEPKNVRAVAEYIANLLNITPEDVAKFTLENTKRFLRI